MKTKPDKFIILKAAIEIKQKGKWFIAKLPILDFIAQGRTAKEARTNLKEVIKIQFDGMLPSRKKVKATKKKTSQKQRITLNKMLSQITDKNIHHESDSGQAK